MINKKMNIFPIFGCFCICLFCFSNLIQFSILFYPIFNHLVVFIWFKGTQMGCMSAKHLRLTNSRFCVLRAWMIHIEAHLMIASRGVDSKVPSGWQFSWRIWWEKCKMAIVILGFFWIVFFGMNSDSRSPFLQVTLNFELNTVNKFSSAHPTQINYHTILLSITLQGVNWKFTQTLKPKWNHPPQVDTYREISKGSGVTGGGRGRDKGQSAPQRLSTGKFSASNREKWGKEKGNNWKCRGKSGKM